jgi:hypothetical protein
MPHLVLPQLHQAAALVSPPYMFLHAQALLPKQAIPGRPQFIFQPALLPTPRLSPPSRNLHLAQPHVPPLHPESLSPSPPAHRRLPHPNLRVQLAFQFTPRENAHILSYSSCFSSYSLYSWFYSSPHVCITGDSGIESDVRCVNSLLIIACVLQARPVLV